MALKRKTGKKREGEMSFLEHLEELRWHIIRSVLAVFALMIVAFVLKNIIFDKIILAPKSPEFFTNRILCALGHAKIFGYQLNIDALCINTRELILINIRMAG
ncbi:MAG: preprotein translocase subunit TatC, partial [Bacteroidales bacterium]|nr:preprotein translocase subunit TatC [Bacteroidales bacterium]